MEVSSSAPSTDDEFGYHFICSDPKRGISIQELSAFPSPSTLSSSHHFEDPDYSPTSASSKTTMSSSTFDFINDDPTVSDTSLLETSADNRCGPVDSNTLLQRLTPISVAHIRKAQKIDKLIKNMCSILSPSAPNAFEEDGISDLINEVSRRSNITPDGFSTFMEAQKDLHFWLREIEIKLHHLFRLIGAKDTDFSSSQCLSLGEASVEPPRPIQFARKTPTQNRSTKPFKLRLDLEELPIELNTNAKLPSLAQIDIQDSSDSEYQPKIRLSKAKSFYTPISDSTPASINRVLSTGSKYPEKSLISSLKLQARKTTKVARYINSTKPVTTTRNPDYRTVNSCDDDSSSSHKSSHSEIWATRSTKFLRSVGNGTAKVTFEFSSCTDEGSSIQSDERGNSNKAPGNRPYSQVKTSTDDEQQLISDEQSPHSNTPTPDESDVVVDDSTIPKEASEQKDILVANCNKNESHQVWGCIQPGLVEIAEVSENEIYVKNTSSNSCPEIDYFCVCDTTMDHIQQSETQMEVSGVEATPEVILTESLRLAWDAQACEPNTASHIEVATSVSEESVWKPNPIIMEEELDERFDDARAVGVDTIHNNLIVEETLVDPAGMKCYDEKVFFQTDKPAHAAVHSLYKQEPFGAQKEQNRSAVEEPYFDRDSPPIQGKAFQSNEASHNIAEASHNIAEGPAPANELVENGPAAVGKVVVKVHCEEYENDSSVEILQSCPRSKRGDNDGVVMKPARVRHSTDKKRKRLIHVSDDEEVRPRRKRCKSRKGCQGDDAEGVVSSEGGPLTVSDSKKSSFVAAGLKRNRLPERMTWPLARSVLHLFANDRVVLDLSK